MGEKPVEEGALPYVSPGAIAGRRWRWMRRVEASTRSLPLLVAAEDGGRRVVYGLLALLVIVGFGFVTFTFFIPAHQGVDQNGYLVGGKMLAEHGSMKLVPRRSGSDEIDIYQFVGRMWVGAEVNSERERYYPKYPVGLPLLYAGALLVGKAYGAARGVGDPGAYLAYLISPISSILAMAAMYLLARRFMSAFFAWLALLAMASSPLTLTLATNPNSHASTLCCVTWGMFFLVTWWQGGGAWRRVFAGLLLGYACTIRYTEGLLVLPILLVVLYRIRWREWKSYVEAGLVLAWWSVPVLGLLAYNVIDIGSFTGYDPTGESTGFGLKWAQDNWETMLRHINTNGLAFVFPLGIAGMIAMFWWNWRVASVIVMWILPCLGIYTFYYWAPDTNNRFGYLRFFLTVLPAIAIGGYWLMDRLTAMALAMRLMPPPAPTSQAPKAIGNSRLRAGAIMAGAGLVTFVSVAEHLESAWPMLENDYLERTSLAANTKEILEVVPRRAVVFGPNANLVHHLQFVGDFTLYGADLFEQRTINALGNRNASNASQDPNPLDPARSAMLFRKLRRLDQKQLDAAQRDIVEAALGEERRVFVIAPARWENPPRNRPADYRPRTVLPEALRRVAPADTFDLVVVKTWREPVGRPVNRDNGRPGGGGGGGGRGGRQGRDAQGPSPVGAQWQIVEVRWKSFLATTQPTTQSTTKPTTQSTTRPSTQPTK